MATMLGIGHDDGDLPIPPEPRVRASLRREQGGHPHSLMHVVATLRRNLPTRAVNLGAGT
jgi:hypothetical protein